MSLSELIAYPRLVTDTSVYQTSTILYNMNNNTVSPNIPPWLEEMFSQEMKSLQEDIADVRSKYDNSKIIGDEAERIFREYIGGYLPETYQLANGQVNDRYATRSREIDVAVCNPYHPFTYSKEGRGMLFIEGVESAIEVKASIKNESQIRSTIEKCQSVRQLDETVLDGMIAVGGGLQRETPYVLFAFDSDYKIDTLQSKIARIGTEMGIPEERWMDIVYVLNRGLLVNRMDTDHFTQPGIRGFSSFNVDPSIFSFLVWLNMKMPQYAYIPDLLTYYMYPDMTE
jgi:hypothetical protein